jgi:hypothetical protein
VQPVALGVVVPARQDPVESRDRREHRGEFRQQVVVQRAQQRGLERAQVVVEGIDDQTERDVALELGCPAVEDEITPVLPPPAQLRQQARLADAGLADNLNQPRLPAGQPIERSLDLG